MAWLHEGDDEIPSAEPDCALAEFRWRPNLLSALERLDGYGFVPSDLRTVDDEPRFMVSHDKGEYRVADLRQAAERVLRVGKRGIQVKRFKGLGEMNPEELRETTMDREVRTLLRVRLEDAVAADRIFTILMGEQVAPRRRFIETHALDVADLDV